MRAGMLICTHGLAVIAGMMIELKWEIKQAQKEWRNRRRLL